MDALIVMAQVSLVETSAQSNSLFLLLFLNLKHSFVSILVGLEGIWSVVETEFPVVVERLILSHEAGLWLQDFVATSSTVCALSLLHLWNFLLGFGLGYYFVYILVRIIENDCRRHLLVFVYLLQLLLQDLVLLLVIICLIALAHFLDDVEVHHLLSSCR